MTPKKVALMMLDEASKERKESEKMIGKKFSEMTIEERRIAATAIAAFYEEIFQKYP